MNRRLYNRILESIDREIKTAINEQFNISDIDFSDADDTEYNVNIFNKSIIDPDAENI